MTSPSPSLGWVLVYVNDVGTAVSHYVSAYGLAIRFEHESGDYAELETGPTTLALLRGVLNLVAVDRGKTVAEIDADATPFATVLGRTAPQVLGGTGRRQSRSHPYTPPGSTNFGTEAFTQRDHPRGPKRLTPSQHENHSPT